MAHVDYIYFAQIERVVDGDTIDVSIALGFDVVIRERVRLIGINAPETRTTDLEEKAKGFEATDRVAELLPVGSKQVIKTEYDRRGKFGRVLADFIVIDREGSEVMLTNLLVSENLAVVASY